MQPGAALQAMLLAVLLAKPRDSKGHLLSVIYFHDTSQRRNFEEAKEACMKDGGQLASIETADEQRLIENFIESLQASDGDFWIGLKRLEEKQHNSTACQDLYAWTDGSLSQFRNWYMDEPSCESEVCVVMYHQPSAPPGIGGPYMFQWNDDRCNTKKNFICKYSDDKPSTTPSLSPGGEATEPAAPILPEETLEIDTKERRGTWEKGCFESCLHPNSQYSPFPPTCGHFSCVLGLDLKREQTDPPTKEQHTIWPTPHQENSPDLEVYNVIRKQSEADLAEPRPDLKNISFRVCSGEAMPDDTSCDYDNMVINPSESGLVTLASMEGRFVTNDIYEFSPDRMGRSKESGWVENEIYY
ncbi:similar to layilin (predicted) [Rattus norvegicus]|uniref:Similar to layilin (Predicted) n=1 Tax=Rattus norvegicus TaxID=10116 RepID=A6J4G7_RAT|nr:similar to layilin (predicted) [Rattus norvegicus]